MRRLPSTCPARREAVLFRPRHVALASGAIRVHDFRRFRLSPERFPLLLRDWQTSSTVVAATMIFAAFLALASAPAFAAEPTGPRFSVQVDAPAPIKDAVQGNLDLVRWQDYAELTPEFLDLLVASAKDQARSAAETVGYFSSTVTSSIDQATKPPTVHINIEPGEPTRVSSVILDVTGPAADDDARA